MAIVQIKNGYSSDKNGYSSDKNSYAGDKNRWHGLNINDPERDELKTARSRKRQFETHRSRKG